MGKAHGSPRRSRGLLTLAQLQDELVTEGWAPPDVEHALSDCLPRALEHEQGIISVIGPVEAQLVRVWLCAWAHNSRHDEARRLGELGCTAETIGDRTGLPLRWVHALLAAPDA